MGCVSACIEEGKRWESDVEDCGWVYPVPVVRVNSRFVDKFFLSDYFFTLAEERARFTSVKKKKRNKKRNASRRFHGRFDEVRQADSFFFFFFFLSISHRLTKRHTRPLKTWNNLFFCRVSLCVFELSSGFLSFFLPGSSFSFFKKLEISTERKKRGFVRTWPTRSLLSLFLDHVKKKNKCVCVSLASAATGPQKWKLKKGKTRQWHFSILFFVFLIVSFSLFFLFLDFLWFDIGRLYITNEVGELDKGIDRITIVKNQMLVGFAFYME